MFEFFLAESVKKHVFLTIIRHRRVKSCKNVEKNIETHYGFEFFLLKTSNNHVFFVRFSVTGGQNVGKHQALRAFLLKMLKNHRYFDDFLAKDPACTLGHLTSLGRGPPSPTCY